MQDRERRVGAPGKPPGYVVYPGLRKWMRDNNMCTADMHRILCLEKKGWHRTKERLSGQTKLCIPEINQLIRATGKTYEYLFLMSEQEVREADG